jgi:hypothetical protein
MVENESAKIIWKGRLITAEEASEVPILVMGNGLPDEGLAYAFDSDEAFGKWVRHTKMADAVEEIHHTIHDASQLETTDTRVFEAAQQARINDILENLRRLAARTGLEPESIQLAERATLNRPLLEPPIFDPAFLFSNLVGGVPSGSWLPIPANVPFPDLTWLGWNDRARGGFVHGLLLLTQHTWWRGRQTWLSGAWSRFDLRLGNFDRIASAAYLVNFG